MKLNFGAFAYAEARQPAKIYAQEQARNMFGTAKTRKGQAKTNPKLSLNTLRIVPANNAFYFFTDIGQYSDKCSTCLADFCNAIQTIDIKSVEFHFKRGDFVLWISETLGDKELADEINKVNKATRGEELRTTIHQTLENRLAKLKKLQASDETYLKRE